MKCHDWLVSCFEVYSSSVNNLLLYYSIFSVVLYILLSYIFSGDTILVSPAYLRKITFISKIMWWNQTEWGSENKDSFVLSGHALW